VCGKIFSDYLLLAPATMTKRKGHWQSGGKKYVGAQLVAVSVLAANICREQDLML
jgi:hypothetical protein